MFKVSSFALKIPLLQHKKNFIQIKYTNFELKWKLMQWRKGENEKKKLTNYQQLKHFEISYQHSLVLAMS